MIKSCIEWTLRTKTELGIPPFSHGKVAKHVLEHISAGNNDALYESADGLLVSPA